MVEAAHFASGDDAPTPDVSTAEFADGEFRTGVRVGVDVGRVRVGVARTDPAGILATPVETITGVMPASIDYLAEIVDELAAIEVIVGLPRSLSGSEGAAAATARAYAVALASRIDVPVRVVDERLTTVSAHSAMHASGRPGRKHRAVVDQVAAVMILQHALEIERSTLQPAGEQVEPPAATPDATESTTPDTTESTESRSNLGQDSEIASVTGESSVTAEPVPCDAPVLAPNPDPSSSVPRPTNMPKPSGIPRLSTQPKPHNQVQTPDADMKEAVE